MHLRALNLIFLTCLIFGARCHPDGERIVVEIKEPHVEDVKYEEISGDQVNIRIIEPQTKNESNEIIKYYGSQLWKVTTDDDLDKKRVLARLRDSSGTYVNSLFLSRKSNVTF